MNGKKHSSSLSLRVLVLVLCVLLLMGCGGSGGNADGKQNFKQGFGELVVGFLQNAPPQSIYPGSDFKIILELDNQAAYDLTNGKVSIIGLNNKYFEVKPETQYFDTLIGRSLLSPVGEKKFLEFAGTSGQLFENANSYRGNYFLKVNYDSIMEFSDTLCINPRLYEVYDSGCKMSDQKSYSGQGAPLAVTDMQVITYPIGTGAKLEFRFKVSNRGQGELDHISLTGAKLGNGAFQKCEFLGASLDIHKALLDQNRQEATLICEKMITDQNSYETTLSLAFTYSYQSIKQYTLMLVSPNYRSY